MSEATAINLRKINAKSLRSPNRNCSILRLLSMQDFYENKFYLNIKLMATYWFKIKVTSEVANASFD